MSNKENINNILFKYGGVISENQTFIDVGSNIGEFSEAILNNFKPKHIYLFEPCKEYLEISKNKLTNFENLSFYNFGLGSKKENKIIYKSKNNIGWNTFLEQDPKQQNGFYNQMDQEMACVERLDSCLSNIDELDFIKIDAEGYEAEVIDGAFELINKYKPYILIEISWGTKHPNWLRNKQIYERLFSIGYEKEDLIFDETRDVLFRPKSRKLPISVGILSWKSDRTLKNTLESYNKNGLFNICDDVCVLFQEGKKSDLKIIDKHNASFVYLKENEGIGKAFNMLAYLAKNKNILLLEHDWELIENEKEAFDRLVTGVTLLNRGFSCVRYRSRRDYGDPLYSKVHYQNNELNFLDGVTGLFSPHLLDCVHWIEDPHVKFPDKISKHKDYFLSSSRWANYTNNPCLYKKDFYLKVTDPFKGSGIELENNISKWWAEQNFMVAQGEGLFKHNDIDKNKTYNIVDIFTYFNEKELLELRIKMLDDYVDKFIICDANRTHTGEVKEFSCKKTLRELGLNSDKIRVIEVDLSNYENKEHTWTRERQQRNAAKDFIEKNDVCFVSDCDEIINPKFLYYYSLIAKNNPNNILRVPMALLCGRADLRVYKENRPVNFSNSFFCMAHHLEKYELSEIRESNSFFINNVEYKDIFVTQNGNIEDAGWHFTWMGDNNKRLTKYKSFMHYFDSTDPDIIIPNKILDDLKIDPSLRKDCVDKWIEKMCPLSQKGTEQFIDSYCPREGGSDPLGRDNVLCKYPLDLLPKEIFEINKVNEFLLPEEENVKI